MYPTSGTLATREKLNRIMNQPVRLFETEMYFSNVQFSDKDIESFSIEYSLGNDGTMLIGACASTHLKASMIINEDGTNLIEAINYCIEENEVVTVRAKMCNVEGADYWPGTAVKYRQTYPLGKYYIDKKSVEITDKKVSFDAYDVIASYDNEVPPSTWFNNKKYNKYAVRMMAWTGTYGGVKFHGTHSEMDYSGFESLFTHSNVLTNYWEEGMTIRQILNDACIMCGCNAYTNRTNGKVIFTKHNNAFNGDADLTTDNWSINDNNSYYYTFDEEGNIATTTLIPTIGTDNYEEYTEIGNGHYRINGVYSVDKNGLLNTYKTDDDGEAMICVPAKDCATFYDYTDKVNKSDCTYIGMNANLPYYVNTYKLKTQGLLQLDVGDVFICRTPQGDKLLKVVNHTLTYNGGFRSELSCEGLDEESESTISYSPSVDTLTTYAETLRKLMYVGGDVIDMDWGSDNMVMCSGAVYSSAKTLKFTIPIANIDRNAKLYINRLYLWGMSVNGWAYAKNEANVYNALQNELVIKENGGTVYPSGFVTQHTITNDIAGITITLEFANSLVDANHNVLPSGTPFNVGLTCSIEVQSGEDT